MADRVGITVRQVSRLETGVQAASWPIVVRLAEALGVTPDAFLQEGQPVAEPKVPRSKRPASAGPVNGQTKGKATKGKKGVG